MLSVDAGGNLYVAEVRGESVKKFVENRCHDCREGRAPGYGFIGLVADISMNVTLFSVLRL